MVKTIVATALAVVAHKTTISAAVAVMAASIDEYITRPGDGELEIMTAAEWLATHPAMEESNG